MRGKNLSFLVIGCLIFGLVSSLHAGEVTVGGHFKLTLYDQHSGTHNGVDGNLYNGTGLKEMVLYITSELTDKISVDLQPTWESFTGASPKFGKDIGTTKKSKAEFYGWRKAAVKAVLPQDYELSAGLVKPRFTWEYGAELAWEDEFHCSKFATDGDLGAMSDSGIEIYKAFELESVSLPAYLYILNGEDGEYTDNNKEPLLMLHVEPETGPLKFLASLATGKWDDDALYSVNRYALGTAFTAGLFSARAEYAGGTWANSVNGGTEDATPSGYYAKVFYRVSPWCRLMLHYNVVDKNYTKNYTGSDRSDPGSEKLVTTVPGLIFYVSDSSIIMIQYFISDWQRVNTADPTKDSTLAFNRLTVGWRTTF